MPGQQVVEIKDDTAIIKFDGYSAPVKLRELERDLADDDFHAFDPDFYGTPGRSVST